MENQYKFQNLSFHHFHKFLLNCKISDKAENINKRYNIIKVTDEITEERKQNPFDKTIANAMANGEIEMSIKNNTQ